MERWVTPAGTSTSVSRTSGSFLQHELWKPFDPNENVPLVFVLHHGKTQCSAYHSNSHLRIIWRFLETDMYIDISNQWGKRPSVQDRALFVELLFLKNTLFCPFKWKCLVGTFFPFSKRLFWRERGLERVTQNARGLTDWRQRERGETPRAAVAVSEFGFEQWSVKVHFWSETWVKTVMNAVDNGLLYFRTPVISSVVFHWKFVVIFILGQWGVR